MSLQLVPYLHFTGQAREALAFYSSVLGGEPEVSPYSDMEGMSDLAPTPESIMHGALESRVGTIYAADGPDAKTGTLTVDGDDADAVRPIFDAFAVDGEVVEPFALAPWGEYFGIVVDRFGVEWYFSAPSSS